MYLIAARRSLNTYVYIYAHTHRQHRIHMYICIHRQHRVRQIASFSVYNCLYCSGAKFTFFTTGFFFVSGARLRLLGGGCLRLTRCCLISRGSLRGCLTYRYVYRCLIEWPMRKRRRLRGCLTPKSSGSSRLVPRRRRWQHMSQSATASARSMRQTSRGSQPAIETWRV